MSTNAWSIIRTALQDGARVWFEATGIEAGSNALDVLAVECEQKLAALAVTDAQVEAAAQSLHYDFRRVNHNVSETDAAKNALTAARAVGANV